MAQAKTVSNTATSTKHDPVFGLINEHKKAETAYAAALKAREQVEEKIRQKEQGLFLDGKRDKVTAQYPTFFLNSAWKLPHPEAVSAHSKFRLEDAARQFGPKTAARILQLETGARREILAMRTEWNEAHYRRRKEAGLERLDAVVDKASEVEEAALERLAKATPLTREGAKAWLAYLKPYALSREFYAELLLETVGAALPRLLG